MKNREFLLLAKNYSPERHNVLGWWASEKLDGMRAFWDGGVTRGIPSAQIPWANVEKSAPVSTGLWSRYGNVIHAPNWWLDALPHFPLDGELYVGRGQFQKTVSICRTLVPDEARWREVKYCIFDAPGSYQFAATGKINNPNFKKMLADERIISFLVDRGQSVRPPQPFEHVIKTLESLRGVIINPVKQYKIALHSDITSLMNEVLDHGGEGLMLREPGSIWIPYRSNFLLKVKARLDAEATVLGYIAGQGKYLGLMGALQCKYNDVFFELSGFTDSERILESSGDHSSSAWCVSNPGKEVPSWIYSRIFPRGSSVTFQYRELTDAGIPKEARYYRVSKQSDK